MALSSRRHLLAAFGAIAALFGATSLAAVYESRSMTLETDTLIERTLESVELIARMGRDLGHRRQLLDAHILEREPVDMARLEAEVAAAEADYALAAGAYAPFAAQLGEEESWRRLAADVAATDAPVAEVLALSRKNQDESARTKLVATERIFSDVELDVTALARLNREVAGRSLRRITALESTGTMVLVALSAAGLMLTLAVGALTTGLVMRREQELDRRTRELEARNHELDAFSGRVAHDLRGPLTGIGLATATLSRQVPDSGAVAILRRGASRMEALIEDLLALSRADAAHPMDTVDPAVAAAEALGDLGPRVEHAGGVVHVALGKGLVRFRGEGLLRQVLTNLVDNALKYRREDVAPVIELRGHAESGRYLLEVADNGVGMSSEDARRAFEPLFRALATRETPGTGLGLAIVKRAVEASGASISLTSRLGEGSTFALSLPLASRHELDEKAA
jgi:signal transduction histidine kinase